MKKVVVAIVAIIVVFTMIGLQYRPKDAQAQIFVEGWYCDSERNAVMHEVFPADPNEPPAISVWRDCGANQICAPQPVDTSVYSRGAECLGTTVPPVRGSGTGTYTNPGTVNTEGQITIGITSDQITGDRCYDEVHQSLTENLTQVLHVEGHLNNCRVTASECGCETKNVCEEVTDDEGNTETVCHTENCGPGDWHAPSANDPVTGEPLGVNPYDNHQCYTNVTCTAGINEETLQVLFVPPTEACQNYVSVNISKPGSGQPPPTDEECRPGTYSVNAPNGVPRHNDRITEDSVSDDLENSQRLAILLPDSVNADIDRIATENDSYDDPVTNAPITGVDDVVRSFFCSARQGLFGGLVQAIIDRLGLICPVPVLYVNNSLDEVSITSAALVNTVRPEGDFPSQPQDCAVSDVERGAITTDGDAKMRQFSSSMGGNDGVYGRLHPDWPDDQKNVNTDRSIYINGVTLNGSMILPETNWQCLDYSQNNLPVENGILFCNDGTTTPSNLAPTPIELPPARECTTSCPAGKTGTCGGHEYWVWDQSDYGPCQCETEEQTCSP